MVVATTATLALGPVVNVGLGLLDATGATGKTYEYIGNLIDKQVGYSVGGSLHDYVSPYIKQIQSVNLSK